VAGCESSDSLLASRGMLPIIGKIPPGAIGHPPDREYNRAALLPDNEPGQSDPAAASNVAADAMVVVQFIHGFWVFRASGRRWTTVR
jgi:hypothetical protein